MQPSSSVKVHTVDNKTPERNAFNPRVMNLDESTELPATVERVSGAIFDKEPLTSTVSQKS